MDSARHALECDWVQGHYVSSTHLDGRVDWDAIEEMANESIAIIEEWLDELDRIVVAYSGGIDSLCLLHIAQRAGVDEAVSVWTPEEYPSHREYAHAMCERWDVEHHEHIREHQNMEWLVEDPSRVFPKYELMQRIADDRQRNGLIEWSEDNDDDMRMYGRRNEDNFVPDLVNNRAGTYQGFPIKQWDVEHIFAYLEMNEIPISRVYRGHNPLMGGIPWHIRSHQGASGEIIEPKDECWWAVRDYTLNYGYTEKWEEIVEYFPDGEELALEYAVEHNAEFPDIEEGYDRGCDANPNPPEVPDY